MRKLWTGLSVAAALFFTSCGDSGSTTSSDNIVSSYDELSSCTANKVGSLEYVSRGTNANNEIEAYAYVCAENDGKYKWLQVSFVESSPEKFKVCNSKREGYLALSSKNGDLYICKGEVWQKKTAADVWENQPLNSSSSAKSSRSSSSKSGSTAEIYSSSSGNSSSKELPSTVVSFYDLADFECNADRKCATVFVEDYNDTYECDGENWNMLISSMPSTVCPARENNEDDSSSSSSDDVGESSSSSEYNEDSSSSEEFAGPTGAMVSCDISGVMGECIEFAEGTEQATQLAELCVSVLSGTLGTGCSN